MNALDSGSSNLAGRLTDECWPPCQSDSYLHGAFGECTVRRDDAMMLRQSVANQR